MNQRPQTLSHKSIDLDFYLGEGGGGEEGGAIIKEFLFNDIYLPSFFPLLGRRTVFKRGAGRGGWGSEGLTPP